MRGSSLFTASMEEIEACLEDAFRALLEPVTQVTLQPLFETFLPEPDGDKNDTAAEERVERIEVRQGFRTKASSCRQRRAVSYL